MPIGSLTIVGTGIMAVSQATLETVAHIEHADKVLCLVADPVTQDWIESLNATTESLRSCYAQDKDRLDTYNEMIERTLFYVRQGLSVCVVYYGHPGIFVYPSHESIRLARAEGFEARMLPGISAEDCLFADLGFDPASQGCQSFEATDFLVNRRTIDPHSHLILWQIGIVGHLDFKSKGFNLGGLPFVVESLLKHYPTSHMVTLYEAAQYPVCQPRIIAMPLNELPKASATPLSTLYVPPVAKAKSDLAIAARLASAIGTQ